MVDARRPLVLAVAVLAASSSLAAARPNPAGPPDPNDRPANTFECVVPNVKRKLFIDALVAMTKAHCTVGGVRYRFSSRIRVDRVISQRPAPGTKQRGDVRNTLVVSRGKRR